MKIDAAVIGNHEFDYGVEHMFKIIDQTMKPNGQIEWISSNLFEKGKDTLGKLPTTTVIEKGELKIGILGVVEKRWVEGLSDLDIELEYHDNIEQATKLVKELREK